MIFRKLRFRAKLFLGFTVVIILSVIFSIISFFQLSKIEENTELIYQHPLMVSNAVRDINICINGMHRSMKDVVLAENTQELDSAVKVVNELNSQALESFEIVFDRFLGDISDVKEAYQAFNEWEVIRNEVITLKRNGQDKAAARITKGKGADHVRMLLNKTKVMTDFAKHKADMFKEDAHNTYQFTIKSLILVFILVISISIFISVIISQSILTPIQDFIFKIRKLYLREGATHSKMARTSEIDLLSGTVEELSNAYKKIEEVNQELEGLNEDLDEKVKLRTIELETKQLQLKEKNEEYAAINEELMQTNEELQIAKEHAEKNEIIAKEKTEEYEAINEELRQINEELQISKEKIEVSETKLKEAQKLAKIGSWELDLSNNKLIWSDEIYRIFDCEPDSFEVTYDSFMDLIHKDDVEFVDSSYKNHILTGEPYNIVHRIVTKSGDIKYVNERCRSDFDSNNKPYRSWGTVADITDRIINEQKLLKAKEKAEESDRLKSAFLANMSHEIRTPMNGIIGFTKLLQKDNLPKEKLDQYVKVIIESSNQLLNIVNDILDISKIETGQIEVYKEKTNIVSLLEETISLFELRAQEKGLKLEWNCESPKDEPVIIDQVKLKQILFNLISNSIKYTDIGFVKVNCELSNDKLLFSVRDSGIGIPKSEHHKIFNRFTKIEYSTTKLYGGTGLGLSICKGYIEILGGEIWFESDKDEGSSFYFTIPYDKADTPLEQIIKETEKEKEFLDTTILVVEDEDFNFDYIKELLSNRKINYIRAKTGKEALEIFKENPEIDLILMDIRLPEIDGYTVTKEIRKENSKVPIIAQTAYALSGDKEKAINAGCNDYIAKPIVEEQFNNLIVKYLS